MIVVTRQTPASPSSEVAQSREVMRRRVAYAFVPMLVGPLLHPGIDADQRNGFAANSLARDQPPGASGRGVHGISFAAKPLWPQLPAAREDGGVHPA